MWYGQNGTASMIGSAITFGLSKINSSVLYSYQIIFLVSAWRTRADRRKL